MEYIRCGRISYINVLPIYFPLESGIIPHNYTFIAKAPSSLNAMMRAGELDISPVSSVEYICNSSLYTLLPNIAITCNGDVMSVLLFSTEKIEDLHNKTIALTMQSETSSLLLKIICKEYIGIEPKYIPAPECSTVEGTWLSKEYSAIMLIGDTALAQNNGEDFPYVYDLGRLWKENTNLPFVFAVWVAPKNTIYTDEELCGAMYKAREWSESSMDIVYKKAKEISKITDIVLEKYYSHLGYYLGDMELQGMAYFTQLLQKYGYM